MPRIDLRALEVMMTRRNFLFKHQLTNLVGISYAQLTEIIANGENEVEEDIVVRLCAGLECQREDLVAED